MARRVSWISDCGPIEFQQCIDAGFASVIAGARVGLIEQVSLQVVIQPVSAAERDLSAVAQRVDVGVIPLHDVGQSLCFVQRLIDFAIQEFLGLSETAPVPEHPDVIEDGGIRSWRETLWMQLAVVSNRDLHLRDAVVMVAVGPGDCVRICQLTKKRSSVPGSVISRSCRS